MKMASSSYVDEKSSNSDEISYDETSFDKSSSYVETSFSNLKYGKMIQLDPTKSRIIGTYSPKEPDEPNMKDGSNSDVLSEHKICAMKIEIYPFFKLCSDLKPTLSLIRPKLSPSRPKSYPGSFAKSKAASSYNYNYKKAKTISYGLIVFSKNEFGEDVVLLYQRRNSFIYTHFITGGWSSKDELHKFFENMTEDERNRILEYRDSFNKLWKDLFIGWKRPAIVSMYKESRHKFDKIKDLIPELIKNTQSMCLTQEWGIPRGGMMRNETQIETAFRECYEETHVQVPIENLISTQYIPSIFTGKDNKTYYYRYYVAFLDKPISTEGLGFDTPEMIRKRMFTPESDCSEWFTLEQIKKIVPSQVEKSISTGYKFLLDFQKTHQ